VVDIRKLEVAPLHALLKFSWKAGEAARIKTKCTQALKA
jgi:hypothetical protein